MVTFETDNFERVVQFTKPLLEEGYQVKIFMDAEGVYSVGVADSRFNDSYFALLQETYNEEDDIIYTLDGQRIRYITENQSEK